MRQTMRLNRYLTDCGFCSRREADQLIAQGLVTVGGKIAVIGQKVSEPDEILVRGSPVKPSLGKVYIAYNKPLGITCTTETRIKGNILTALNYPHRIFPIGRLDKDSTGLILLTNDGDIVNKVLRSEFGHEKEYRVEVHKPFGPDFVGKLSSGVDIGDHVTLPCKVFPETSRVFRIILTEGKNRQIRRMCSTLGFNVKSLQRIRIMGIHLGDLKLGQWREIPRPPVDLFDRTSMMFKL